MEEANALVAQGIEHRFPNPKMHMGKTRKRWKFGLFAGPIGVAPHAYCR